MSSNKSGKQKVAKQNVPYPGPDKIQDAEATTELPDGGRGPIETDPGHQLARKTPKTTGGQVGPAHGTDVGLHGTPDVAEASDHGNRGKN